MENNKRGLMIHRLRSLQESPLVLDITEEQRSAKLISDTQLSVSGSSGQSEFKLQGPVVRTPVSANPGFVFLFIQSILSDNFLYSF